MFLLLYVVFVALGLSTLVTVDAALSGIEREFGELLEESEVTRHFYSKLMLRL